MKEASRELITGMLMGVLISLMLALVAFICIKCRCRYLLLLEDNPRRASTIPICTNGVDAVILSDSTVGQESPVVPHANCTSVWLDGTCKKNPASLLPGIPKYTYRDLQKATCEFTSVIGQGAFGPVFKATVSTGETVAVKVLDTNSKQGEQEFQTEVVLLLGRLHHRNLVNLLGYCADKGQLMLVYMYMTNGSLASHLYCEEHDPLNWTLRVDIALDVARGLEYLHYGAVPPVVHRDIKPSNVLLDQSMRARVADFGLSREAIVNHQKSNVKGTFGYLDPEYISSKIFTKKSDVYSFGVLLLEMIAGRSPQQGLMDYVELAAMDVEGTAGWDEIVDPRLSGAYNAEELHNIGAVAHKCINPDSGPRPSMSFVVQALSQVVKARDGTRHREKTLLPVATAGEEAN
ncbi:unnamed protein product [Musa acuminata var. zebrina]